MKTILSTFGFSTKRSRPNYSEAKIAINHDLIKHRCVVFSTLNPRVQKHDDYILDQLNLILRDSECSL